MSVRILLVDDHQMLRDGLRSILASDDDIEVVGEAGNGHDAVAMARALAPDLVVMDIGMQGLNGVEATRKIKAQDPRVKVLALSTYSDERYVMSALEAGASGYVIKAAAFDELRRAIRALADGKSYLTPDITAAVLEAHVRRSPQSGDSAFTVLGSREREILQLLAEGRTSPEIARRLHISPSTVETHRRNIMRKLDLHSVAELTKYAIREGLTTLDP